MGNNTRRKKKGILFGLVCFFGLFVIGIQGKNVKAQEDILVQSRVHMYADATLKIADYLEDNSYRIKQCEVMDSENKETCITVSEDGVITALSAGNAIVEIVFVKKNSSDTTVTKQLTVIVHEVEELTASYGSTIRLAAFDFYSPYREEYVISNQAGKINDSNQFTVLGLQTISVSVKQEEKSFLVAKIHVIAPALSVSTVARAVGTTYQAQVIGYTASGSEKITYTSANENIVSGTDSLRAHAAGESNIQVKFTAANGDFIELPLHMIVTNPVFREKRLVLAKGMQGKVTLTGTCAYSVIENTQGKGSVAYFKDNAAIYANKVGKVTLYLQVDGKTVGIEVIVSNPRFANHAVAMYKGASKQLSIAGLQKGYSKISYRSLNKKILSISKQGKIKAKKVGNAYIAVTADGKSFRVLVQISKKKAYQAAKKEIAISKRKTTYSQARRMLKKYYDCSSLVSRVYRQFGQYFGKKRGWSPTAADIGFWCTSHKKVLFKKGVSYKKLLPGDLIFYSYEKNGRYRNISHIEMYVGNGKNVSASSSYGKVVHYDYHSSCTVLIARPTK